MPEITLLSQETIDKIAAGEVVERPSSVSRTMAAASSGRRFRLPFCAIRPARSKAWKI